MHERPGRVFISVQRQRDMGAKANEIEVEYDFQGGVTLTTSGVKNGLLAAIQLGLVNKPDATEILLLIKEATQRLIDEMID
jgi:hypothetical protein